MSLKHRSEQSEESVKKKKPKKKHRLPRISQVAYFLFFIATLVFVSKRGGAFSYALFYATLIYPPLAFFYLLYTRSKLRIYQELSGRELQKNSQEPYALVLENAGMLPTGGITLYTYGEWAVLKENLNGRELTLLPKERVLYSTTLCCRYAGSYVAGVKKLVFKDCFGLFFFTMNIPTPLNVQVLPVVDPVMSEKTVRAFLTAEMESTGGRMRERENTPGNEVKPYAVGDPIKRIHWKNYARTGDLYVRLPEEKDLTMVAVALLSRPVKRDGSGTAEWTEETISVRDRFLDTAASVAAYFAGLQRPVQFFFYNAGVKRVLVEDYTDVHMLCKEISKELVMRDAAETLDGVILEEAARPQCPVLALREDEV